MIDEARSNKVISINPVRHSRDLRVRAAGTTTEDDERPFPIILREHTGNYVESSKSMEAEGTQVSLENLGEIGRASISMLVAHENFGLKKLKTSHYSLANFTVRVDPGRYAKDREKEAESFCSAVAGTKNVDDEALEKRYAAFRWYLCNFTPHYFDEICADGCLRKRYPGTEKTKTQHIAAELLGGQTKMFHRIGGRAVEIDHRVNTFGAETFNSHRTVLTRRGLATGEHGCPGASPLLQCGRTEQKRHYVQFVDFFTYICSSLR
eukprot:IDg21853t1